MVRLHCQPGPRLGSGTPRLWLDVMVVAATRTTAARASTREAVQLNFVARPPSRRGRYARVMPVNCELVHTHSSTLITPACGVRQREPAAFEDHAARVKRSGGADLARECLKDRAVHEELPILMALQLVAVKRSGHKLPGASCSTTCCKRAIAPIGVMWSQPSIATAASVSHSLRRCCR